jgi:hypothetical protein
MPSRPIKSAKRRKQPITKGQEDPQEILRIGQAAEAAAQATREMRVGKARIEFLARSEEWLTRLVEWTEDKNTESSRQIAANLRKQLEKNRTLRAHLQEKCASLTKVLGATNPDAIQLRIDARKHE